MQSIKLIGSDSSKLKKNRAIVVQFLSAKLAAGSRNGGKIFAEF